MRIVRRKQVAVFSPNVFLGGAMAGILGAVCMGLAACAYTASIGSGWSTPMQAVAGTFYKTMAFVGGPGVTTIGVLTHLAVGAAYGVLLAALTRRIHSPWKLFWVGIPYAVAIWAFMTWVVLPVFDWVMLPRVEMMATMWFFLHWIYAPITALCIPALRDPKVIEEIEPGHTTPIRRVA